MIILQFYFKMKNVFTMGKLMINFMFVNCPRVKNKLFNFTIDNIFFASTYWVARYYVSLKPFEAGNDQKKS